MITTLELNPLPEEVPALDSLKRKPGPQVSIIVPVYKVEPFLRKCLDSILAQYFTNFEVLLIDDGSPDGSGSICDDYARNDPRVRTFHQPNAGVSAARNLGLDNARGEWLAFVDSDDWVEPEWLSVFVDESARIVANNDLILFGRRKLTEKKTLYEYTPAETCLEAREYVNTRGFYMVAVWSCFIRRHKVDRYGIRFSPSLKFAEDTEFLLKVFATSGGIAIAPKITYNYVLRQGSATNGSKSDFFRASQDLKAINGFLVFCESNGLSNEQFAPSVRRSYRIFLRNYLRHTNPKSEEKSAFLALYRETVSRHPIFRSNLTFQVISKAWVPSLTLIRALMRINLRLKTGIAL